MERIGYDIIGVKPEPEKRIKSFLPIVQRRRALANPIIRLVARVIDRHHDAG